MNSTLDTIAEFLVQKCWQMPIAFSLVFIVNRALRNASAHWRYWLWIMVVAKCLLPPLVGMPLPLLPAEEIKFSLASKSHSVETEHAPLFDKPNADVIQQTRSGSQEVDSNLAQRYVTPSAARDPISESPTTFSPRQWLAIGWLVIAAILIGQIVARMWSTSRRLKRTTKFADEEIQSDVTALAISLGMKRPPAVYVADSVAQPFVLGWLRGDIFLPLSFSRMGTVDQRRAILTHELAHVLRWDAAVNLLQNFVQALFFFHPVIWWTNQMIRQEREKCCDEIVLSTANVSPNVYCGAIVDMMRREDSYQRSLPVLEVAGSIKNIKERIATMLSPNRKFRRRPSRIAVIAMLLFAVCVLPTTVVVTAKKGNAAQDGLPDSDIETAANVSESNDSKSVSVAEFQVSNAEFAIAADKLRSKGGFVRTFHERGSPDHWVQVILESPSTGMLPTLEPVDETKSPTFTDEDLAAVRILTLDSQAHVHLRSGKISAAGISQLSATKISRLEISGFPFDNAMAAELFKLTQLEDLSFDSSQLTASGVEELSKCSQLKSIDIEDEAMVSLAAIELLPLLPNLEAVSIRPPLDRRVVAQLDACEGIHSLRLQIVDFEGSQAFTTLTKLKSLSKADLSGDGITEELIVALTQKSQNLKELYLRNHHGATVPAMKAIAELPRLEVLSLDGSNVTDAGIVALNELRNLRWLDLSHTEVTDRSLIAIGNMSKLGMLDLMRTNVSSSGLERLSRLTELWRLNLEGTYVQTIPDWMRERPRLTVSYDENQQLAAKTLPIAEPNSLEHAVAEFNARAGKDKTGKFEPALTTDEVVAAIRSWDRQQTPIDDATFKIFTDIANTLHLPEGSSLGFNTAWEVNGVRFHVWWIDLDVMTGENVGYTFRIRERKISSTELP